VTLSVRLNLQEILTHGMKNQRETVARLGIKIRNKGKEEEGASEATQVRIRLMHGAFMIDKMDKVTFESWKNMPICNLDWYQMNMFIGL
jgi:hypothetical protein